MQKILSVVLDFSAEYLKIHVLLLNNFLQSHFNASRFTITIWQIRLVVKSEWFYMTDSRLLKLGMQIRSRYTAWFKCGIGIAVTIWGRGQLNYGKVAHLCDLKIILTFLILPRWKKNEISQNAFYFFLTLSLRDVSIRFLIRCFVFCLPSSTSFFFYSPYWNFTSINSSLFWCQRCITLHELIN